MLRSTPSGPLKSYNYTKTVSIDQLQALRRSLSRETAKAVDKFIGAVNHGEVTKILTAYHTEKEYFNPETFAVLRQYGLEKKEDVIKALDIIDAMRHVNRFTPSRYR